MDDILCKVMGTDKEPHHQTENHWLYKQLLGQFIYSPRHGLLTDSWGWGPNKESMDGLGSRGRRQVCVPLKLYTNLSLYIWEEALQCSSTYQRCLIPNSSTGEKLSSISSYLNSLAFIFKLTLNVNQQRKRALKSELETRSRRLSTLASQASHLSI